MKHTDLLNDIIQQMEQGTIPWAQPWVSLNGAARSHYDGHEYSVLNQLFLQGGEYVTFAGVKREGGKVKKGATAHYIIKPVHIHKKLDEPDENGEDVYVDFDTFTLQPVFNVKDDTEGLTVKYYEEPPLPSVPVTPVKEADDAANDYLTRENILITRKGDKAYYSPGSDSVTLPPIEQFDGTRIAEYYSTLFHELGHSTGHETRLNRPLRNKFGSKAYAKEELTAELTAAIILNTLGIDVASSITNTAAYLQSWLKPLKDDKNLLFTALGKAEKAARLILNRPIEAAANE